VKRNRNLEGLSSKTIRIDMEVYRELQRLATVWGMQFSTPGEVIQKALEEFKEKTK